MIQGNQILESMLSILMAHLLHAGICSPMLWFQEGTFKTTGDPVGAFNPIVTLSPYWQCGPRSLAGVTSRIFESKCHVLPTSARRIPGKLFLVILRMNLLIRRRVALRGQLCPATWVASFTHAARYSRQYFDSLWNVCVSFSRWVKT